VQHDDHITKYTCNALEDGAFERVSVGVALKDCLDNDAVAQRRLLHLSCWHGWCNSGYLRSHVQWCCSERRCAFRRLLGKRLLV
jgi:hypothetical protein